MRLEDAFAKLLGRQATDIERLQLFKTRDALGLQDNDALWLVLIALQYHQSAFDAIPARIETATNEAVKNAKALAETEMLKAASEGYKNLTAAVQKSSVEIAREVAGKDMTIWALGALIVATLALCAAAAIGYNFGKTAGNADGYAAAKDEKAAAAWGNTTEGKLAFRMAQTGYMTQIANCSAPGWEKEKGFCYPHSAKDGTHGWALPK